MTEYSGLRSRCGSVEPWVPEEEIYRLARNSSLPDLLQEAGSLRDRGHGELVTYSRKVFIPLTHLCRDVCHYCTFAAPPRSGGRAYMTPEAVLETARRGVQAGCKEALFTLGDKPELRYKVARSDLEELGHNSTLSYLGEVAKLVMRETGLLPHLNPGLMEIDDLVLLKSVSASMGLMLESLSPGLTQKGGAHYGSPDKDPGRRLKTIERAGRLKVPFTTGILIGIGETRRERIESLLALRHLHMEYGHLQEIIIQNFRAKAGTKMAGAPEPSLEELLWTIAMARLIFGANVNIQSPPNLSPQSLEAVISAGINDWGGVSPVTPDFVNPEAPWPAIENLARQTARTGNTLVERLTVYPEYLLSSDEWLTPEVSKYALRVCDAEGLARTDEWLTGIGMEVPTTPVQPKTLFIPKGAGSLDVALKCAFQGDTLRERDIVALFQSRGTAVEEVCQTADELRSSSVGDVVRYVVNRNINYTNVCYYRCQFCAFSKGKLSENLRGRPYILDLNEIVRRAQEAWQRGATEVCLQGGIHPNFTGDTYLEICRAIRRAVPSMHIHAFSPLEVYQGAETLGVTLRSFLESLRKAGLGTLPGTAAEILDDEIREIICPDKITTEDWVRVIETAHQVGFRTTATIMFGHVDGPLNWARHLLVLRRLQKRTGGITEFVPLPFVASEAPLFLKGKARNGPTFREVRLMHAVARLALFPVIPNIQTSWVKLGPKGVGACLNVGANDLGGTLMNESITRAAGARHGQEMSPQQMEEMIEGAGRQPQQRNTTYGIVDEERRQSSLEAGPMAPIYNQPAVEYDRI
jgi:FO synthase